MHFGALGSDVGSRHQEQNREGGKVQNGQYMASWAGLLHFCIRAQVAIPGIGMSVRF
jgi:hypothetical protein